MNSKGDQDKFKELLNNEYNWPARYTFKFIVKVEYQQQVQGLFDKSADIVSKPSSGDKYVSVTIHAQMVDAEAILAIYQAASAIPGIIAL